MGVPVTPLLPVCCGMLEAFADRASKCGRRGVRPGRNRGVMWPVLAGLSHDSEPTEKGDLAPQMGEWRGNPRMAQS